MNESKKNNIFCIVIVLFFLFSFSTGYYVGHRLSIQQTGQSDNEFRDQLADKQRRIDELETRLNEFRGMVSDGFRNVSGAIDRISEQVDIATKQAGDIRATANSLREAVKILENSRDYFRELSISLFGGEHDTGSE
jgi:ABC-type transporter Mla subunit MlaD